MVRSSFLEWFETTKIVLDSENNCYEDHFNISQKVIDWYKYNKHFYTFNTQPQSINRD